MPCLAYSLGKPCPRPNRPGAPYCEPHLAAFNLPHTEGSYTPLPEEEEEEEREVTERVPNALQRVSNTIALGRVQDAFERVQDADLKNSAGAALCQGLRKDGRPCGMFPPRGQDYCLNHAQGADRGESARRAGRASALARIKASSSIHLLETVVSLTDRASIQAALDVAIRLYLADRIEKDKFDSLVRACGVAMRNFDKPGDNLLGPKPQEHDWETYFRNVSAMLQTIDPLLVHAYTETEPPDESNPDI